MGKSELTPKQSINYIGFAFDSVGRSGFPQISVTRHVAKDYIWDHAPFDFTARALSRVLSRVLGGLVSTSFFFDLTKLMLRNCFNLLRSKHT